jgi:ribosomal protein S18 acetylase RimI-like enzyme
VLESRTAGPSDIAGVVETLAMAFYLDPVWSWAFADPLHRKHQHEAWFRLLVGSAVDNQSVWTTPAYEAVAVWVPPGCAELSDAHEALLAPTMEEILGERARLVMEVFDRFEAAHPRNEDHYYLSLLATHTDHRGSGLGVGLLAENLTRIDAAAMPTYLESTNPANLRRYESLGFEVRATFSLPENGPTVTTMWREPQS